MSRPLHHQPSLFPFRHGVMTGAGTQGTLKDGTASRPERAGWWFNQMRNAADKVPESAHHPKRSAELSDEEFLASLETFTEEIFRIHPPSI